MLSIGEFSRATGLPVKTLRFYHERKLLVPAHVEMGSGYRFYDEQNLETARIIVVLRELEFSLNDIQAFLAEGHGENETVVAFLERRKEEVLGRIRDQQSILARLDQIIAQENRNDEEARRGKFDVERRELDPILVAGVRMKGAVQRSGRRFWEAGTSRGPSHRWARNGLAIRRRVPRERC